jgi:hypothetical protein
MPGFMAMIETIPHWVMESDWKLSRSPVQTAFQIAFNTPLLAFSWIVENPDVLVPIADHLQVSRSVRELQRTYQTFTVLGFW